MALLLLFLYSCITSSLKKKTFTATDNIDQTHSVLFPPISSSFLFIPYLDKRKQRWDRFKGRIIYCHSCLEQPVSQACKSLCFSSHDYKLGRQFTIVGLNATGSERKAAEKTSVCYFSIGALAPDAAEPWSDARTVIWRIPLVSVALEVPLYRKCDMSQRRQRSNRSSRGFRDRALQLATVSGHKPPHPPHMTSWTSRCFSGRDELQQTLMQQIKKKKNQGKTYMCDVSEPPTWRHRYRLSALSVVCQTAMFTNILPPLTA